MNIPYSCSGILIKEPVLKYTDNGKAVCNMVIKVTEKTVQGTLFPLTVWQGLAENCTESLSKGDKIIVIGLIKSNVWEDKHRQKRETKYIQAFTVGIDLKDTKVQIIGKIKSEEETEENNMGRNK